MSELLIEDQEGIRFLTLNRPEKLNAIDYAQHLRLMAAFQDADLDPKVDVVVLLGVGRAFCAGDDLTQTPLEGSDPFGHRRVDLANGAGPTVLLESCRVLRNLSKPTVAAMHGVALGSGYDYSLSCDFRLVTNDIRYGDPRIDRALWAAEGWSYKLPRLVNLSTVSSIAYLGKIMNGRSAVESGLAHTIISGKPDVRSCISAFLTDLQRNANGIYAQSKATILASLDSSYPRAQYAN